MNDIVRMFNQVEISQRPDGYLNATAMCKANEKDWFDYFRLETTRAFLAELAASIGYLIENRQTGNSRFEEHQALVVTKRGGKEPGTWIHPQVAYHLAQWCSPAFAVQVSAWIHDIATKGFATVPGVSIDIEQITAALQAIEQVTTIARTIVALADRLETLEERSAQRELELIAERKKADSRHAVRDRISVLELLEQAKAVQKGRRSINARLGNALRVAAAAAGVAHEKDAHSRVWLFPTDFARAFMARVGNGMVADHNSAQTGQGVLPFPDRKRKPVLTAVSPEASP